MLLSCLLTTRVAQHDGLKYGIGIPMGSCRFHPWYWDLAHLSIAYNVGKPTVAIFTPCTLHPFGRREPTPSLCLWRYNEKRFSFFSLTCYNAHTSSLSWLPVGRWISTPWSLFITMWHSSLHSISRCIDSQGAFKSSRTFKSAMVSRVTSIRW